MNNECNNRISPEQAKAFATAIADDISEYVKNHKAEYELFLLDEKECNHINTIKRNSL